MSTEEKRPVRTYEVNGQDVPLRDPTPTARDLLLGAGRKPPSEHQLISVDGGRTRHCPHEDNLPDGARRFRAFEGDRLFAFTVDEVSQVWGEDTAAVSELLEIFGVADDHELVQEREGQPDVVLAADGEVEFGPKGVEDLVTRRRRHDKILVAVLTTAGVFPSEGNLRVEPATLISEVLERAARRLGLTGTEGWVVTADGRDLDPNQTFSQNGLSGTVTLNWHAPEGGGGA